MLFCSFDYFRIVKQQVVTYFISVILFTLMLFKVTSFHVYTHQDVNSDEIENCGVCELATENQNTEFEFTAPQIFQKQFIDIAVLKLSIKHQVLRIETSFLYGVFGRPPPALV